MRHPVLRYGAAALCVLGAVYFLLPLSIGVLHSGMLYPAAGLLLAAVWLVFPGLFRRWPRWLRRTVCVVLLAGWVLGPMYGGAAAGLGSMLADLVSGYPLYAPGTFVIKACMAVCAWAVFRAAAGEKRGLAARIGGALAGEAVMVAGYFAYEGVVLGFGLGAAAAIPGNLIQGVFGLAVSVAAAEALSRSGAVKEL